MRPLRLLLLSIACCSAPAAAPVASRPSPPAPAAPPEAATAEPAPLASTGRGALMVRVDAGTHPPLWVDRTEASELMLALYRAEAEGSWVTTTPAAPRQVALVSLEDAEAYCRWAGKRLPTIDEWHRAAGLRVKGSVGAEPEPVDAGVPNEHGVLGTDNTSFEWTATPADEERQKVGGLVSEVGGVSTGSAIVIEDGRAAVRCAADQASPVTPPHPTVTLMNGAGVCARRGRDRATFCMSLPNGYFAPEPPDPGAGWVRASNLDGALAVEAGCALWPELLACDVEGTLYVRKTYGAERLFVWGGRVWARDGKHLRLAVDSSTGWYDPPTDAQLFPTALGLLEIAPSAAASWVGAGGQAERTPVTLPVSPSAVLDFGELVCLRHQQQLSCGQLDAGGFVEAGRLDLPVRSAAISRGAFCLLRDDGAVHCGAAELAGRTVATVPLAALRALPPPTLTGAVELAAGDSNICAARDSGEVHCFARAVQQQLLTGAAATTLALTPAPLPEGSP